MNLFTFLRRLLQNFVDVYEAYLVRTVWIALAFSILSFIVVSVLVRLSGISPDYSDIQISLLSYFFGKFSVGGAYIIVDLTKPFFIFFISFFSLGLSRSIVIKNENEKFKFSDFWNNYFAKDYISLILALVFCAVIDYGLFRLQDYLYTETKIHASMLTVYYFSYLFRIYMPFFIFSFTTYSLCTNSKPVINFKRIFLLFVSLWLFNIFADELMFLVRRYIFGVILLPFPFKTIYIIESILAIPMMAFFILGYHAAMTTPLILLDEGNQKFDEVEEEENSDENEADEPTEEIGDSQ